MLRRLVNALFNKSDAFRLALCVLLFVAFGCLTGGATFSIRAIVNILQQSAIVGIAAIGQSFVMLTGAIDISLYGAGLLISVAGAATMTSRPDLNIVGGEPWSIVVGIGAMLLMGCLIGWANGVVTVRFRVPALITTLAMWQVCQGLAQYVGKGYTITDLPRELEVLGRGTLWGVPTPVITMLILFLIAFIVLNHSALGRSIYTVGGSAKSAHLSGIPVNRIRILVFVVAGLMIGIAAVTMESRMMAASTRTLSSITIDSIAAATVGGISIYGGRGSILSVLLATLALGIINNGLSTLGAHTDVEGIVKGGIILAAVAVDVPRQRKRYALAEI